MKEIKNGDCLTVIRNVSTFSEVFEIKVENYENKLITYKQGRKKTLLNVKLGKSVILLKGHNLGIMSDQQLSNKGKCTLFTKRIIIGGLPFDEMQELLLTNLNPYFSDWQELSYCTLDSLMNDEKDKLIFDKEWNFHFVHFLRSGDNGLDIYRDQFYNNLCRHEIHDEFVRWDSFSDAGEPDCPFNEKTIFILCDFQQNIFAMERNVKEHDEFRCYKEVPTFYEWKNGKVTSEKLIHICENIYK